jgi:hypothetical protein
LNKEWQENKLGKRIKYLLAKIKVISILISLNLL